MLISIVGNTQINGIKVSKGIKGKSSFEYERSFLPNASFLAGVRTYSDTKEDNNFRNKGTRLTIAYRQYLNSGKNRMNGLYLSPIFSLGRHKVSYLYEPSSRIGWTLLSLGIGAATGNLSNIYVPEVEETVIGKSIITAQSLGVNLGYQKKWNRITMDMGMNISKNVNSEPKGMKLSDNTYQSYNPDLQGTDVDFYFGFGFVF